MNPHTRLQLLPEHRNSSIALHSSIKRIDTQPRRGARMRAFSVELEFEPAPRERSWPADIRVPIILRLNPTLGVGHSARIEAFINPFVQEDDLAPTPLFRWRADQLDCAIYVARSEGGFEACGGGYGRDGD